MGNPFTSEILTADYRNGCVYLGGKKYPAGTFVIQLLNQYYVNDAAARIAVFRDSVNFRILDQLRFGFLNIRDFENAGRNTLESLKALPTLQPFDMPETDKLRENVQALFTEANGERICAYFRNRASVSMIEQEEVVIGAPYWEIDKSYVAEMEDLIAEVRAVLGFFDSLADDLILVQKQLKTFISHIAEVPRCDEKHLLPAALEVFGSPPLPLTTAYIGLKKSRASTDATVARRLRFDRYYSFLLTDFFEGLHYGHFPRCCPICGSYFLMQSARKTMYCSGLSPYEGRKGRLTCRAYAASIHRKELAEGDPVTDVYNRRCAAIRSEASRGTITKDFAGKVRALAKERKQRAQSDHDYAVTQYEKDMERVKLYHDAEQR